MTTTGQADDERGAAMRAAMAPTVSAVNDLCDAVGAMPARFGHHPKEPSRGMSELAAEAKSYLGKSQWTEPVQGTHSLGAFALFAASDSIRAYATLFDNDKAPVYAHLVLARAVCEASVVAAWLNDPVVEVDERIRRGVVERLHSARQQQRIKDLRPKGTKVADDMKAIAEAFGWHVDLGKRPEDTNVAGTKRPAIGPGATAILVDLVGSTIGQTLWSYLSGVMHASWYARAQAVLAPPDDKPGSLVPSLAGIGTDSGSVNTQTVCVLRLFTVAAERRVTLMGWQTDEWLAAKQRSDQLREAILKAIAAAAKTQPS